jgi:hypothetical protein
LLLYVIVGITNQVARTRGNAQQAITQIANQVATDPYGPLAQAITQLAYQQAAGNEAIVSQMATQIAQQYALGGTDITQIIILLVLQQLVGAQELQSMQQAAAQVTS